MKWYEKSGTDSDVVISTRVRLARNVSDLPFPARLDKERASALKERVNSALDSSALGANFTRYDFDSLDEIQRGMLVEQYAASKELASGTLPRALYLSDDSHMSIMVNEEDHLRLQVMGMGLCIDECMSDAKNLDTLMDERLGYAFDEKLGYLTACPTNLGCGLRLSVMLHLPALTENGAINSIITQAGKLGFAVRGIYGEGTRAEGSMYQLSNALSLGRTEEETATRLKDITMRIIETERSLRRKITDTNRMYLEDRIYRALGTLQNARILSSDEAVRLLSEVRMGANILPDIKAESIDRLMCEIRPYHILNRIGANTAQPRERDIARAELVRERLN